MWSMKVLVASVYTWDAKVVELERAILNPELTPRKARAMQFQLDALKDGQRRAVAAVWRRHDATHPTPDAAPENL